MEEIKPMSKKQQSIQTDITKNLSIKDDLEIIYKSISKCKKAIVLTGAGISCNAGIPDFRSSNGLYNMTPSSRPIKGKDLFDISLFNSHESISEFAVFMSNLYTETQRAKPTPTHEFIYNLSQKNKLIRCYTQNIDGLESKLGMKIDFDKHQDSTLLKTWKNLNVVQLHGDINTLSCTACYQTCLWSNDQLSQLRMGELPDCPQCIAKRDERVERGKRNTGTLGRLRPNIVLYGENHPFSEVITTGLNSDLKAKPDVFIIMGTSLKVHGVKALVKSMSQAVHSKQGIVILVNKDIISGWNGIIDYQITSDCDEFIQNYETYQTKYPMTQLQTPPSTPKKICRIKDLLNTPSPQKKRKITVFNDNHDIETKQRKVLVSPEESPKQISPRKPLKNLNFELNNLNKTPKKSKPLTPLHDFGNTRKSPRIKRIQDLLNE